MAEGPYQSPDSDPSTFDNNTFDNSSQSSSADSDSSQLSIKLQHAHLTMIDQYMIILHLVVDVYKVVDIEEAVNMERTWKRPWV